MQSFIINYVSERCNSDDRRRGEGGEGVVGKEVAPCTILDIFMCCVTKLFYYILKKAFYILFRYIFIEYGCQHGSLSLYLNRFNMHCLKISILCILFWDK